MVRVCGRPHHVEVEKDGETMLLEAELSTLHQVGLLPRAEGWRGALAQSAQRLRNWVFSSDTFALWVSDYAKICRSLNELNTQMEHLSWMLKSDSAPDSAEHHVIVRAIDRAVDRIGELAGTIDAELRHSALVDHRSAYPN
jgi:hypothetical protein